MCTKDHSSSSSSSSSYQSCDDDLIPKCVIVLDMSTDRAALPEGSWTLNALLSTTKKVRFGFDLCHPFSQGWQEINNKFFSSITSSKKCCGIVISGSFQSCLDDSDPNLAPLLNLIRSVDIPILGICYGAQAIARANCGVRTLVRMGDNTHPEMGIKQIASQPNKDPVFSHLPSSFYATTSHNDAITFDNSEMTSQVAVFCSSTEWPVHAFRIESKRQWGVQFHPEIAFPEQISHLYSTIALIDPSLGIVHEREIPDLPFTSIFESFLEVCTGG